jgi:NADH-quinone oxidoreductase subunit L
MTIPLMVLATFAALGGIFNPGLFSKTPALEHWLEPVFEMTDEFIKVPEGSLGPWLLAWPGIFACFFGGGAAYFIYVMKGGAPAKELTAKIPRLYQLVLDKWRIDELYQATVISMVDSMADTAALFDKWVIDGIIARLTALVVAAAGSILRAFQSGVVHVYAAVMVVGMAIFGWFFMVQPQARASVRESSPGKYLVEAAPGLGYEFRWHSRSPDQPDAEAWTQRRSIEVDVPSGETKVIKVEVKNAFRQTSTGTVTLSAPAAPLTDNSKAPPVMKGALP